MTKTVPIDEYISDEFYPGFGAGQARAPWAVEPLSPFQSGDEERFWLLDFHYPQGMVPLGFIFPEDGILWATQLAAHALPLPTGKGLAVRMVGPHVYSGQVEISSRWEVDERSQRVARNLPAFLERFEQTWADRVVELESGLRYFESNDRSLDSPETIGQYFSDAQVFFRRAWEIHFEMMYPLLATYVGFHGLCTQLGLDPSQISTFLQGTDSKIMEVDRQLWRLTASARQLGLRDLFAEHTAEDLLAAMRASEHDHSGTWLDSFDEFLNLHGYRTEGTADVALPSWREDPTSPLGTIKTFLALPTDHNFDHALSAATTERDDAIEEARRTLATGERARFDEALTACQAANFAWWNEEHNYYIDLRAHLPLRRAALALATACDAAEPTDGLFLFRPELEAVMAGKQRWASYSGLIDERRDYYDTWVARRPDMPKLLGTIPDDMDDPVMREIFGMGHDFFQSVQNTGLTDSLSGMAASAGVARGPARVLHSASELHRVEPGEILVCEATSPNWTPAFAKIAGCVCDSGGSLTHAAIVAREYRVPAVVGTGVATNLIRTGDIVEVDGSSGIVRIVTKAEVT